MPGIFLTTNVFAHVGGLFFPLSFTRKKAWQRKRTVAAAYARLDRRFFKKSLAKTSICLPDVWKFSFFGVYGSALTGCRAFLRSIMWQGRVLQGISEGAYYVCNRAT